MSADLKVVTLQKCCSKCDETKDLEDFPKVKGKHNAWCKSCHTGWHRDRLRNDKKWRENRYKQRNKNYADNPQQRVRAYARATKKHYGLALETVFAQFNHQKGLCANEGCLRPINFEAKVGAKDRAVIDHCHATGNFRGVLCNRCNILAGQVESDIRKTMGIIEYLRGRSGKVD